MARSRRSRYSSSSESSSPPDSSAVESPSPRRARRPRSRRRGDSLYSLDKAERRRVDWDRWPPRYEPSETSSDETTGSSEATDSDSDGSRRRLRPPSSAQSQQQQQTKSCMVLFIGLGIAILLVSLGGYALLRYFNSSATGGAGGVQVITETVTLPGGGGVVTTTVNIGIGFLPDYKNQDMAKINSALGIKSSYYGWYAQLPESGDWDGAQLLSQMNDIKACNCIFQPAVMPTKGWRGLTASDNSQAKAIAKVMKKFTDEGIEVWLRFAHEVKQVQLFVHWYVTDGTYQGGVQDFKPAWAEVAKAVADNPKVRMFFTPNVAGSLQDYVNWMPDDLSTIHYLGIGAVRFVDIVKPLYDKYCADGNILFAMGETGTPWSATIDERLAWLDQLTSAATAKAMPYYVGISWFNYDKETNFYLYDPGNADTTAKAKAWLANGTSASGAKMGNA
ncbi:glycoside hydrolase family 26 protein [Rhodotorula toruloides NP11]|uniref:Glycoside hydrolase family 26 protein n=1 Tax=Rhodotorula toruloides (strain NP11) TaxID=1130832 RepID=M7WU59_RHOT1|nr:glycoside hydrolase family 26 protein [Rhodotorula toruloides NP11]EMS21420.1 glycoside hydrolase family 26 protein [Rhodotorula toruloides NP11]